MRGDVRPLNYHPSAPNRPKPYTRGDLVYIPPALVIPVTTVPKTPTHTPWPVSLLQPKASRGAGIASLYASSTQATGECLTTPPGGPKVHRITTAHSVGPCGRDRNIGFGLGSRGGSGHPSVAKKPTIKRAFGGGGCAKGCHTVRALAETYLPLGGWIMKQSLC